MIKITKLPVSAGRTEIGQVGTAGHGWGLTTGSRRHRIRCGRAVRGLLELVAFVAEGVGGGLAMEAGVVDGPVAVVE